MPKGIAVSTNPGSESIDVIEPEGLVTIEWNERREVLYVHMEGRTILRMGHVKALAIEGKPEVSRA